MILCMIFGHKASPYTHYILDGKMYCKCQRCGKKFAAKL